MSPTLRYLIKETALRWRTRPSSPLARGILTFTLAATAGGFLAGFSASADALRNQLARFGFDTLVVRTAGISAPTPSLSRLPSDHWALPLAAEGRLAVLQQIPQLATTAWGQPVTVFTAPWPVLAELLPAGAPLPAAIPEAIWLTRDWPAGRTARFQMSDAGTFSAVARPAEGPWHALLEGDALLVPAESLPATDGRGGMEVVLFTPQNPAALDGWVQAVRSLFSAETGPAPILQDPGPLRAALAALEHGQALWRTVVLALLGAGVVLVFAAIGILEHREVRFSQALLRSLGIRARLLWSASLGENLLLANTALASALIAVHFATDALLAHLPSFDGATNGTHLSLQAGLFLLGVVNVGVLTSLLPLARSLRRPIGAMLA
jgi:hypothetical protein